MIKKKIINRLSIIQGHLGGIKKMIEEDRDCNEIITQTKAVKSSLSNVENMILETYAIKCMENKEGNTEEKIREIVKMILKNTKN